MIDAQPEEQVRSYIIVQFSAPGSTILTVQMDNVTPLQLHALAKYFEFKANVELGMQEQERLEQERMRHIAKPADRILIGK